ncbi:MAG TPA: universal stress protein [Candidatus Akkermansia intestinigallinarum]|uniref:Universal stress protein n=1 Tax=Candidatus Akkermansia intestinigallinarum TaxID=2838431 RepID=A0A9D1VC36_9BACT|nr:universal stress protein [Candidatus Akkermansia intestinigallinarum]
MVRILAATDFSDEGKPVLDFTANLVRQCGGKMYLLHAVEPCMIDAAGSIPSGDLLGGFSAVSMPDVSDCNTVLEMADKRAKKMAEDIGRQWDIPIYGKAEEADDIVECVHDFCERHHIDVLVIGNRHHSLLTSILLGNTAEKLVRAAKIPVTVVPCGSKAKQV